MDLQLIIPALPQYRSITATARIIKHHGFIEQVEAIDLVDCAGRGVDVVEDDKRLPFCAEVRLGDDFEDRAVFGEELFEGFFQLGDVDAFFEVADLDCIG